MYSSKKHLFEADRDHYRKPQLVKMQRTTDMGYLGPVDTSITQHSHLRFMEHLEKGQRESEDEEVSCELYLRNERHLGHLNAPLLKNR